VNPISGHSEPADGLSEDLETIEWEPSSVGRVGVGVDSGLVLTKLPESGVKTRLRLVPTRVERSLVTCM
jgi:hypothetical protein